MTNNKYSKQYPFIVLFKIISTFDYKSGAIRFSNSIQKRMTINEICNIIGVKTSDFNKMLKELEEIGLVKEIIFNKNERYLDVSQKLIKQIENGNRIRNILRDRGNVPTLKEIGAIKRSIKKGNKY